MNAKTLLAAIFAALLLAASGADAQVSRDLSERKQQPAKKDKQEAAEQTFPNATREEPAKLSPNSKFKGKLSKLQALYHAEEFDAAIASAEAILADPKANPAERSSAG